MKLDIGSVSYSLQGCKAVRRFIHTVFEILHRIFVPLLVPLNRILQRYSAEKRDTTVLYNTEVQRSSRPHVKRTDLHACRVRGYECNRMRAGICTQLNNSFLWSWVRYQSYKCIGGLEYHYIAPARWI